MSFKYTVLICLTIIFTGCGNIKIMCPSEGVRDAINVYLAKYHDSECYEILFEEIDENIYVSISGRPKMSKGCNIYRSKFGNVKIRVEYCNGFRKSYERYTGDNCILEPFKYDKTEYSGYDFSSLAFCLVDSGIAIPVDSNYKGFTIITDSNIICNASINTCLNNFINNNVAYLYIVDFSRYNKEKIIEFSVSQKYERKRTDYYFFRQGRLICIYGLDSNLKRLFFNEGLIKFKKNIPGYLPSRDNRSFLSEDYIEENGILKKQEASTKSFEPPKEKRE